MVSGLIPFVISVPFLYRIASLIRSLLFLYLLLAVVVEQLLASPLPVVVAAPVGWLCVFLLWLRWCCLSSCGAVRVYGLVSIHCYFLYLLLMPLSIETASSLPVMHSRKNGVEFVAQGTLPKTRQGR
jgi:hypothetical protein